VTDQFLQLQSKSKYHLRLCYCRISLRNDIVHVIVTGKERFCWCI